MVTLSESGRVALCTLLKSQPIHTAWGEGDGVWTSAPVVSGSETALISEIGRRRATEVISVFEDLAGDIIMPNGERFSRTLDNTRRLYIRTDFDFPDASGRVIRETALFIGTQTASTLPATQKYFTPGQVTSPGNLFRLENHAPIYRYPYTRERFEVVITL
jgi:hypothetical protein